MTLPRSHPGSRRLCATAPRPPGLTLPLGVCARRATIQTPRPAWEGTLDCTARATRCCLHLTPSPPLRPAERAPAVAEKSAERPSLGYRPAPHGVCRPQAARDPAAHGAVSAGNRGCRRVADPRAAGLAHRPRVTSVSVAWTGWPWNLWRKGTSFSNCGHRCVSRLRPPRGRGGGGTMVGAALFP